MILALTAISSALQPLLTKPQSLVLFLRKCICFDTDHSYFFLQADASYTALLSTVVKLHCTRYHCLTTGEKAYTVVFRPLVWLHSSTSFSGGGRSLIDVPVKLKIQPLKNYSDLMLMHIFWQPLKLHMYTYPTSLAALLSIFYIQI